LKVGRVVPNASFSRTSGLRRVKDNAPYPQMPSSNSHPLRLCKTLTVAAGSAPVKSKAMRRTLGVCRRILGTAGAAGVHFDLPQILCLHRVEDKVGEMVRRHPIAQIRREQQRSIAIDIYETTVL